MLDVRSRTGIVAVTTGAALLLALPVVAAGQVPDVGEVVGGVREKVPAVPAPPAPPVNLPATPAPAPAPKPQSAPPARGPAAQAPAAAPQAPPAHARANKPANPGGGGNGRSATAPSPSQNEPAANQGGGSGDGGSKAGGDDGGSDDGGNGGNGGKTVNTSQDDGAVPTDVEIADQLAEAPVDANPSTLPFTGFQLALMVALGLAAVGTGFALRRGARSAG